MIERMTPHFLDQAYLPPCPIQRERDDLAERLAGLGADPLVVEAARNGDPIPELRGAKS